MKQIDPLNSTRPEFNRRAFAGIAGAAALGAATIGNALAQGVSMGKLHAPLVAEDDPAINAGWLNLDRPDQTIRAYHAAPKNAGPGTPGVVVVMHIWGVDTSIRDFVRRLAKEGYVAIVPDLYDRQHPASGDGATDFKPFSALASNLNDAQVDGDLRAAADWIRLHHTGKIGVTGFCMGGSITLRQAVDNGDIFSAAAVFYGKVRYATGGPPGSNEGTITPMALAYADEIHIPVFGGFGARDSSIRADDVRALAAKLTVPNDVKVYPEAGHAFMDDQRDSYVASAASDAWERLKAFFAKYLR